MNFNEKNSASGISSAVGAYLIWGFIAILFKLLGEVGPLEILAHRIIFSSIFLFGLVLYKKQTKELIVAVTNPRIFLLLILSAFLIGANWGIFIWATSQNLIVESSMGYYMSPIMSVLLATIFFKERLSKLKWVAIGLITISIINLTLNLGKFPYIALTLCSAFAFYGVVKKTIRIHSFVTVFIETVIFSIPAIFFLLFLNHSKSLKFLSINLTIDILLISSGVLTALPLILYSSAAQKIKLSTLGILQYLAPTTQLLIGVFMYGEDFTTTHIFTFSLIWIGLILYSTENIIIRKFNLASAG
jgi:chloramphenicol-sensitive protein RarD